MEIVKPAMAPTIMPFERPAYDAMNGNFITKYEPEDASLQILKIVTKGYLILNQEMDERTVALMAMEFCRDLQSKYKFLTVEEVELSVLMGVKEELAEIKMFPVMSVFNLNRWVKTYIEKIRRPVIDKQKKFEEKLSMQTDSAKELVRIGHLRAEIIKVYETFCIGKKVLTDEGNEVYEPCTIEEILSFTPMPHHLMSIYYQHINKFLTVDLDDAERWSFFRRAEKYVQSEEKEANESVNLFDVVFNQKREIRIMDLGRSYALTALFTKWKESGYTLLFP